MSSPQCFAEPIVDAGVGKTETAFRLSETLFAGKKAVSEEYGRGEEPCGLLALRGEDYSPSSEAAKGGVHELHSLLKARIVDHLVQTEGNALILFDEVQKVMPGTLEVCISKHPFANTSLNLTLVADADASIGSAWVIEQHEL